MTNLETDRRAVHFYWMRRKYNAPAKIENGHDESVVCIRVLVMGESTYFTLDDPEEVFDHQCSRAGWGVESVALRQTAGAASLANY